MSRTIIGLALGGTLLIIAAACSPGASTETVPANVESLEATSSDIGNTEAQSPESEGKPLVTVSRSPT